MGVSLGFNMGKGDGQGEGQGKGGGDWNNGLFGCFNSIGNCCCGYWCFPCQVGSTATRVDGSYPLFFLLACCVPCIPIFLLRGKVRDKYGIEGSTGGDCMASWCCERVSVAKWPTNWTTV